MKQIQNNTRTLTFGSVSDMRSFVGGTGLEDDEAVFLSDVALNGFFYWNASSTATDDGASVIKIDTVPVGRFIRLNPYSITSSGVRVSEEVAAAGQTSFTVPEYTTGINNIQVFLNGSSLLSTDFTETSSTEITLDEPASEGDTVRALVNLVPNLSGTIEAASVSFTQVGTGSVTTNVQAKLQESVSVKDFGALGGASDYTTELQAAIDYCQTNKTRLRVPDGVYRHTGLTIDPSKSLVVVGDGYDPDGVEGSVLLNTGTSGENAITIDNTPFTVNYDQQIGFFDICIKGNSSSGDGFNVNQTMVHLQNVWITSHGGNGYYAERCYSSSFRQVSFSNNSKNGFQANRALNAVHFDHCLFNGNAATTGYAGCALSGATGTDRNFGVKFTVCDFTGNGPTLTGGDVAFGIAIQHSAGVTLDVCYAEGNYSHNLFADGTTSGLSIVGSFFQDSKVEITDVPNLIFENNTILDSGGATTSIVIDCGLPDDRFPFRMGGNEYFGTVTQTFNGGAGETVQLKDNEAPTGGTSWLKSDIVWNTNVQNGGEIPAWINTADGSASFIPFPQLPFVFANHGDADATLTPRASFPTNLWQSPITANRTVTLSTTNAFSGCKFRVTRSVAATGAFTLDVGGLKSLSAGEWADVEYDGSAWRLTAFGTL